MSSISVKCLLKQLDSLPEDVCAHIHDFIVKDQTAKCIQHAWKIRHAHVEAAYRMLYEYSQEDWDGQKLAFCARILSGNEKDMEDMEHTSYQ